MYENSSHAQCPSRSEYLGRPAFSAMLYSENRFEGESRHKTLKERQEGNVMLVVSTRQDHGS